MAITFTDDQLKSLSKESVVYTENRAQAVSELNGVITLKAESLAQDNQNKQFTDFYEEVIFRYHEEYKLLTGDNRTEYTGEALIQEAGLRGDTHFPATPPDVWTGLVPRITDANNGLPVVPFVGLIEPDAISGVDFAIDILTNGFNDGVFSANTDDTYTIGDNTLEVDDVTGFDVNDRILILSGSDGFLAQITAIDQDDPFCSGGVGANQADCELDGGTWNEPISGTLTITLFSNPDNNIGAGASVSSSASGFSEAQRDGTTPPVGSDLIRLNVFKGIVDSAVLDWESLLSDIDAELQLNEDQKRKSEITTAISNIDAAELAIDTWQALTGESRFGDTELGDLTTAYNTRSSQIGARITEIETALGTLVQAPDGAISGPGVYFDYYDWMNKRVNLALGSLSKFNNVDLAVKALTDKVDNIDSNKAEIDSLFRVELLSEDSPGFNIISLADTSGFNVSDSVKIIADGQVIIDTTISVVTAETLELADNISTSYSLSAFARVVKIL